MSKQLSPAVRTVLQLLQARQMFIGDELRVSSLRVAWTESGQNPEEFGHAISELQQLGYARSVHGTSGPAIQLTHEGYRAASQPVRQPDRPTAPPRQVAARRPLPRPDDIHTRTLNRPATPPPATSAPAAAPPTKPRREAPPAVESSKVDQELAHAQVFRTRNESLNDNVLRHCVLGLLRHHRIKPDGHMTYADIMRGWGEMGLTRSDLLYALDVLIRTEEVRTTMQPEESVILTQKGYDNAKGTPKTLDEGMDRLQAIKRLRQTKQLGSLRAAS